MVKKLRCQTCTKRWCRNHVFQLAPISNGLYFRKKQMVRLCPHFSKNLNKFCRLVPVFNKDKKFYTPSFYHEEEEKCYVQNDQRFLLNHTQKVQKNGSGTSELVKIFKVSQQKLHISDYIVTQLLPKHGSAKKLCNVCRQDYQDYQQHIVSPQHKKNIKGSKYTAYISDLQKKYKQKNQQRPVAVSAQVQAKIKINNQSDETNEVSGLGFPYGYCYGNGDDLIEQFYQFKRKELEARIGDSGNGVMDNGA